jgi:hypothetical protein
MTPSAVDVSGSWAFCDTILADMDAGDDIFWSINASGEASDVWNIFGHASDTRTFLQGTLLN